jgi:hypothetical protein
LRVDDRGLAHGEVEVLSKGPVQRKNFEWRNHTLRRGDI